MIVLAKDNVEKIVATKTAAERLVELGYTVVSGVEAAEPQEEAPAPEALEEMTTDQLRQIAKEKGVKGVSSLKKDELLTAIRKAG